MLVRPLPLLDFFVALVMLSIGLRVTGGELLGVLHDRAATVSGILNGVDYAEWSPENDKFAVAKFSPDSLAGKQACKKDLFKEFGLAEADPNLPLVGIVSRFAAQKGFDLIAQIAERLVISERTVKSHVNNILGKLQVADRTQAAIFAWREGFARR